MHHRRDIHTVGMLLVLAVLISNVHAQDQQQSETKNDPKPVEGQKPSPFVRSAFSADGRNIELTLLDKTVRLRTRYGTLDIPLEKIQRIEFAMRISEEDAKEIAAAITRLGSNHFQERKAATKMLFRFGRTAYSALKKTVHHDDPEVATRAKNLVKDIEDRVPKKFLEPNEYDVVHTANSRISGRIEADAFNVLTARSDRENLKLSEICMLRFLKDVEADVRNMAPVKATVGGKYSDLLRVIKVEKDAANYGPFRDYGYYTGTSWGGHTNLPPGYWVYVTPNWYIWKTSKIPRKR